jgi:membrane protein DedA with SNARE-associated domain/rhodanese-related sulfurtransferase
MTSIVHSLLGLLEHHTYSLLFGWVLLEQGGVPIPTVPIMLALGTMSAAHRMHVALALPLTVLACLISDSAWFFLGRRYGNKILDLLCRFSMETDTCVSRTAGHLQQRGAVTLLFAKFVPGLATVAPPLAGQAGISFPVFLAYDAAGSLAWGAAWLFAGRFFGDLAKRSNDIFGMLEHFGPLLVLLMVVGVIVYRYAKRQQFLRELRGLRLEPAQLLTMIADADREGLERPFIIDLRHPLDVLTDPLVLPGALRLLPEELKQRKAMIPRDRDIVLYCTCPSEETSAKVALELRRMGVKRVRPLRGGLQGWKDAGYPLDTAEFATAGS